MFSSIKSATVHAFGALMLLSAAGCQTQSVTPMTSTLPENPTMQQLLDEAATADLGAQLCQSYGGLRATNRLNALAENDYAKARAMGATDADIRQAQIRARQKASADQNLTGNDKACNDILSLYQLPSPMQGSL
ncbi:hypothetical protein [Martelella mediterranea]|uniref:Lipoprotein n=1 Tax=Martelella mediterranea TaxID=293089 RepID=A0A4V2V4F3_9HYPH|nr:hypothetical protein [Martelella mediterranea]TCT38859.1 hypothetical protein EDC90_101571 [Martelella mediterranea]